MTFELRLNSDEIENMPQASLKALIANRMNVFASGVTANESEIARSKWRGNPKIRGAYTFSQVGALPKNW